MAITLNGSGTATGLTAAPNLASSGLTTGKIVQIVSNTQTTATSTTSYSWVDTNLSASITPSSSSNKIYIIVQQPFRLHRNGEYDTHAGFQLLRGSTVIQETRERGNGADGGKDGIIMGIATSANNANYANNHFIQFLDSPNTTSSTTYKTQYGCDWSTTCYLNNTSNDTSKTPMAVMTLMEVAA